MAGAQPFESLFDKLRSSNGPANDPSRPSSNPQFSQASSAGPGHQQRSSAGAMSQPAYGFDYNPHTRSGNDSLLMQTLESAISSHPSPHRFASHGHNHTHTHTHTHNHALSREPGLPHPHHPPSFSPQPLYGSIDQTMHPAHYSPTSTTQLNRQLGADHGRHSSADDPMVPQNYLMGLLHKQNAAVSHSQSHQGRRSVDNIPQVPQRFEAVRDGARSTSFAESTSSTGSAPVRPSLSSLHGQPLNELVSSLLSNAPPPKPQHQDPESHAPELRNFMSPPPREVANPAAADLLHQILGRSKPVQEPVAASQANEQSAEPPLKHPPPGWAQNPSAAASVPDTAPESAPAPAPVAAVTSNPAPIFTYVNPFEQLSKTNPRNRSPKVQSVMTNGNHSPALTNNTGIATPSRIPLPFSPPPLSEQVADEVAATPVEPKTSLTPSAVEAGLDSGDHSPPPTQLYSEAGADSFAHETDPFEGETDPFENVDSATPAEGSADNEEAIETMLDVPDIAKDNMTDPHEEEEEEAEVAIAEAVSVETVFQTAIAQPALAELPANAASLETTPVPVSSSENALEKAAYVIYKFPMKPFSQINFNASPTVTVPGGRFSDIAKMLRNADQMDRNLISASPSYIVYATGKSKGGVRIIRQEDGQGVVLMKESAERSVNVSVGRENQVLAVGVNGTVLWCELDGLEGPMDETAIENRSFLFPPSPLQDQNGGLTKSRTHLSLSHPKVFAIGRGRFISFIHADAARQYAEPQANGITRINDSAYHTNHSRTIDTQKVSKEFSFSEDDTTVVTIDKAGKIKFWDVSKLVDFESTEDEAGYPSEPARILTEPALTRSAVSPGENYKATSVIFVDKQQPYERRQALRYLLIGLQQNHVIQLWDIAIGRAVQELRFPTSPGSDGLCSLCYHPKSGIIVVGNPTRNTISFIHLSTPKYNLQPFTQAGFIKAISELSPNLPKLDATAIMSSIVEYSLGDRGQLISLEVLDSAPSSAQLPIDEGKPPIFELYISHTNGLTCISLCKEDLGFDGNMRVMKGLDALTANVCTLSALIPPTITSASEPTPKSDEPKPTNVVAEQPKPQASSQQQPQPQAPPQQKPKAVEAQEEPVPEKSEDKPVHGVNGRKAASMSGLGRGKKPRRDVNTVSFTPSLAAENDEPPQTPQPKKNKGKDREDKKVALSTVSVSPELLEREMKKIEDAVNSSFSQALNKEIGNLYRRFDEDRRVQQAASDAKQEAVLRVVSNTLSGGLEATIDKVVLTHMAKLGLDLKSALVETVPAALSDGISRHIEGVLPKAVEKSVTSKAVLGTLAEAVLVPLREDLDATLCGGLEHYLQALDKTTLEMSKALSSQITKQSKEALKEARKVHEEDTQRIAQLTSAVAEMAKTIATLESTTNQLIEMQQQLLANQEKLASAAAAAAAAAATATATASSANASVPPTPMTAKSEVEQIAEEVEAAIRRGEFETGMLMWLQSKEMQDFYFENAVIRYNPYDIIPKVSQVVVLTIAASVTGNLDSYTEERLIWLEACLTDFHTIREENTQTMLPRITAVLVSRLQQFYMAVAEENPGAGILKRVAHLSKVTSRLMHNATL